MNTINNISKPALWRIYFCHIFLGFFFQYSFSQTRVLVVNDKYVFLELYEAKQKLLETIGEKGLALAYEKKNILLNDEINKREQTNIFQNLKGKHETEEQTYENQLLRNEGELQALKIKNQRYTIWGISLFLFLLLVLIIILFRMYDYIAKTNKILKEKQEVLNKNNLSLAEINNQKDNLFSIVAHDVRSPIAAILSSTKFLNSNYESFTTEELKVLTGELERQTLALYELIESVLVWAKSQMNGFNFKREDVLISEVVNLLLDAEQYSIDSKNIEVVSTVSLEDSVKTDQQVLQVILRNFLSNAVKFTPIGGKITFTSLSNPNEYHISVTDNGIGMSPEQLKKVLTIKERFSLKGTQNEPGNGIGLILCQEIAKKIEGRIEAQSVLEQGSTFTLILPRRQ